MPKLLSRSPVLTSPPNAPDATAPSKGFHHNSSPAEPTSSPVHLSPPSSRQDSRFTSPHPILTPSSSSKTSPLRRLEDRNTLQGDDTYGSENSCADWDNQEEEEDPVMPSDLRASFRTSTDGKSHAPLLGTTRENGNGAAPRPSDLRRRSTFHERDPDLEAKTATRKRYTYAACFLLISLVAFTVQTETAVYIQHNLRWKKAYAMLYFTHGSWTMLWFLQLAIIRLQKWNMPWQPFWRRHVQILRQTALMVEHGDISAPSRYGNKSPVPYMLKMTAGVTCALTVAGGSWYLAVDMTTASDLTAIYNCSAFFAYVFSVPILHERLRWSKVSAVGVAIAGVFIVAYGDTTPAKHGSKSGGGTGGTQGPTDDTSNRSLGNLVIGVGSVLYGLYEVLYKKYACPPEGTSPGRSMIFANLFGTLIGSFTLLVLWIPLPILHFTGIERFELPRGEAAWMLLISVFANAVFSGSFLVLISLTSPVLSSVAALLTIFLVALVDQLLPPPLNSPLTPAAVAGGCLIIVAFLVLSWATYREMDEERRRGKPEIDVDSDGDEERGQD